MTDRNPLTDPHPGDILRDTHGRLIAVVRVADMRPMWVLVMLAGFQNPRRWWTAYAWRIYVNGAVVVTKGA